MPVILRCPKCRDKFKYDVTAGWPDQCPLCLADINNRRADDDVVMPNILSFKTKANDGVARQIMDGSEHRAEMAAAMAGVPASEMSSLKVTDLNDRRDTEISAPKVVNVVTQHMEATRHQPWQRAGLEAVGGAHTTGDPYAGARARSQLQKALPPVASAPVPLEVLNPNYVKRA